MMFDEGVEVFGPEPASAVNVGQPVPRSSRPEVRNPMLALPSAGRLLQLDAPVRKLLRDLLLDLRREAHERAEASWKARKGPMAVYFRCVAVYAGHIARLLR